MSNQENQIIKIIEETLPSVISILPEDKDVDDFKNISQDTIKKILKREEELNGGSGFIVDENGIVVTVRHILSNSDTYKITTNSNASYKAKKIGVDTVNDIAFLKIESDDKFQALPLGDSSNLKLGQSVLAIGNVLGIFSNTVSEGIISGLLRSITASDGKKTEENLHGLIQTDAAINPGNSGGPLINSDGEAVGINSASVAQAENIGFAMPINIIKKDLEKIKKFGTFRRPFLGVRYIIIDKGALIIKPDKYRPAVVELSPADKAGLKEGDVITRINENEINKEHNLEDFLEESLVGQRVKMVILREKVKFETTLKLEEIK
ncbi:MAG: trypsin-like peptidase domain-containing protein [Candidatus Paceibacterota bacterium]|jgi:S1-C subfamily serine protease